MADHRIRLRGAWESRGLEAGAESATARRVDLPITWPESTGFPLRLVRHFGRPPVDPAREDLVLELDRAPGLLAVRLNGIELALDPSAGDSHRFPLDGILLPRNALLLDCGAEALGVDGWGEVALRIRPRAVD